MSISSPQYWRDRKSWSTWLGRKGTVLASTLIHVGSPAFASLAPYPYVIVDFGDEQRAFLGVGHDEFMAGETVECVWRKLGTVAENAVISYGIKVQKYAENGAGSAPMPIVPPPENLMNNHSDSVNPDATKNEEEHVHTHHAHR